MTRDEILTKMQKLIREYYSRNINLLQFTDAVEKLFTNTDAHSDPSKEEKQESDNDEPENIIHLEGYKGNYKVKLKGYFSEITINEFH